MRITLGAILLATLGLGGVALAQSQGQPVNTIPYPATTKGGNASSTIASTGVFQKLFSASSTTPEGSPPPRHGCTIVNNGTHSMYVSEGLGVAASTVSNTTILAANGVFYCAVGNIVLTGEVDITGTAGDAFYAAQY